MDQTSQNVSTLVFGQFDDPYTSLVVLALLRCEHHIGDHTAMQRLRAAVAAWCQKTFEGNVAARAEKGVTIIDLLAHKDDSLLPFLREQGILEMDIHKAYVGNPLDIGMNLNDLNGATIHQLRRTG